MGIMELSIFTAVGIVVAFGLGFFVGIGYQKAEDFHEIKHYSRMLEEDRKTMDRMTEQSKKYMQEAYELGKKHQKCIMDAKAEQEWQQLVNSIGYDEDNIRFGGF